MKKEFQLSAMLLLLIAGLYVPASIFAGNDQIRNQLNQVNNNFFIENKGQWPPEVKYLAKVGGMNAWITNSGVVYDYFQLTRNYNESQTMQMAPDKKQEFERKNTSIKGHVVKMSLVDANTSSVQQGNNKQEGYYNYFIGNDKYKWASSVPLYGDLEQNDIYKSMNVKYYFDDNSIRYDYIIKPGADLSQLKLKFEGQESIRINDSGELVIKTSLGEVTNGKLYSYQIHNGIKKEVTCNFAQTADGIISLNAMGYDKNKELIIDPLVYSTFIGGSGDDFGNSIAIDASGNAYITGETFSTNYPTTLGAYQTTYGGSGDAFITKLNSAGSALVYSTYMGGNNDDWCNSISIDASGNAYIVGTTSSDNYPTTPGAYQTTIGSGGDDAFITKLNPAGSALVYSTYMGGSNTDEGNSIAIDANGNAYITGYTSSTNYPITPGAYQTTNGGSFDAFITKLNPAGSALVYSSFIGGSADDLGYSIAIDASGNAYITGETHSTNYPTTPGAYQTTFGGGSHDPFITKLNPAGSALVYSTYIGGSNYDYGYSIAIDASGNAYITGVTNSTNYPTTPGAYQTTFSGSGDAFITKLNPAGSALVYSTFIGSATGLSIAVDASGNAYITGYTYSTNYPTTPGAYQTTNGGLSDVFATKLNSAGSALVYSTYIGGSNSDDGRSIAIDASGNAYITGYTYSTNYPTTPGAYQTTFGGGSEDAFVTKFFLVGPTLSLTAFLEGCTNKSGTAMSSVYPLAVKVELHDATTKAGIESQLGILSSAGVGTFTFSTAANGTPYYIVVKSPNTIETWSAMPQTFASSLLSYDFTTAETRAYGRNMVKIGSKWCIYNGDVNQDGLVDAGDLAVVDNDNANYVAGRSNTDVNGDGIIDSGDLSNVDNNNAQYINKVVPSGVPPDFISYGGQTYHIELIGAQYWLKENLNIGTQIDKYHYQLNNGIIEKYCYNDSIANCAKYGGFYNLDEAMQYLGGTQGICPTGWHIPSSAEFITLESAVNADSRIMLNSSETIISGVGTNVSGFSALLSGYMKSSQQPDWYLSLDQGTSASWWSTSESPGPAPWYFYYLGINFGQSTTYLGTINVDNYKDYGHNIRCIKN